MTDAPLTLADVAERLRAMAADGVFAPAERARQLHNMWLDYLVLRGDGDQAAPDAFDGFVRALHGAGVAECDAFLSILQE